MVYQIRNRDGSVNLYSIWSIVEADGTLAPIRSDRFPIQETGL
jgi:hypothetical protein